MSAASSASATPAYTVTARVLHWLIAALVLPMSGETGGLCVPQDLRRLRDCKCTASPPPTGCESLPDPAPTPGSEACKRLDAVLALAPTADPQHAGSPADCARRR